VVERLLFDRVDGKARTLAIGGEHHRITESLAHKAESALPLVQLAVARTEIALNTAII